MWDCRRRENLVKPHFIAIFIWLNTLNKFGAYRYIVYLCSVNENSVTNHFNYYSIMKNTQPTTPRAPQRPRLRRRALPPRCSDHYVRTEVQGDELRDTMMRMMRFFAAVMDLPDSDSGFPRWTERPSRLVETAWVLWQWGVFIHHPTGSPMTFREICQRLCHKLHVRMPANIYGVGYVCRQPAHRCIVDYYAMLWRENRTGLDSMLLWYEPPVLPRITSYRGMFTR